MVHIVLSQQELIPIGGAGWVIPGATACTFAHPPWIGGKPPLLQEHKFQQRTLNEHTGSCKETPGQRYTVLFLAPQLCTSWVSCQNLLRETSQQHLLLKTTNPPPTLPFLCIPTLTIQVASVCQDTATKLSRESCKSPLPLFIGLHCLLCSLQYPSLRVTSHSWEPLKCPFQHFIFSLATIHS